MDIKVAKEDIKCDALSRRPRHIISFVRDFFCAGNSLRDHFRANNNLRSH